MRILLVQRYFWPEPGLPASMLRAIAGRLAEDGHEVTVLTVMPPRDPAVPRLPRKSILDGFRVLRLRLPRERRRHMAGRLADILAFSTSVAAHLLGHPRRYDMVTATTAPPVFLAATVRIAARLTRRPYVYHCQDLLPEGAVTSGFLRPGWRTWVLGRLDRATVQRAAAVVVLSSDMADTLRARGLDGANIHRIPNFIVDNEAAISEDLPTGLAAPQGVFRVLYAGALGVAQRLDVVLEAARRLRERADIQFAFVGSGIRREALMEQAEPIGGSVVFYPQQPPEVARAMIHRADLGLVSLAPGVYRVSYPSKTAAYLSAGCPVLAVVEPESELARFLERSQSGLSCPPNDPAALAETVLHAQQFSQQHHDWGAIAVEACGREFGAQQALDRWSALLMSVARQCPAAKTGNSRRVERPWSQ